MSIKLVYSELPTPICKQMDCDIVENPAHWVKAELDGPTMRAHVTGRAALELLRRGLESGIFDGAPVYRRDVKRLLKRARA